MTTAIIGSSFNIFGENQAIAGSRFTINARQIAVGLSQFDIITFPKIAVVSSQSDVRANTAHSNASLNRVFTHTRRSIYARNTVTDVTTFLGFIAEGDTTLTDVALADGSYEIEVRTSNDFWDEARSKIRFTVQITSGVIEFQDIPNIENLRTLITNGFGTQIRFNIPDVSFPADLQFGVWSSATSPVDVSGTPDEVIDAFEGVGAYRKTVTQTVDLFYAVAAFTDTDQGVASEVFQEWDLTLPSSPPDQYSYDS